MAETPSAPTPPPAGPNALRPPPIPAPPPRAPRTFGATLKLIVIGGLVVALLVPLALIGSLVHERLGRRDEAVREITATWGQEQIVAGPVLIVPYRQRVKSWKEQVVNGRPERVEAIDTVVARAYFLPETLTVDGSLNPSRRHRGIYEAVVYDGTIRLDARFAPPSFEEWKVAPEDILWEDAEVDLAVTDLRGTRQTLMLKTGDREVPMLPGCRIPGAGTGIRSRLTPAGALDAPFDARIELTLNGSRSIRLAPLGRDNDVTLKSTWPDPSFQGDFLPATRTVGPEGFEANWKVSYYGRKCPPQWTDAGRSEPAGVADSLFGVDLVSVVDTYRLVERSTKYGILFVALTFTAFFLFEVLATLRVHPLQYTLVGAALCLFYLALLSLSEIVPFGAAYTAGAAACTLLIALYAGKALRSGRRSLIVGAGLGATYGFLYVILRLQDLSLLAGTVGLFLALAAVMYATRNIDWYAQDGRR
jgi:inner membrane protein